MRFKGHFTNRVKTSLHQLLLNFTDDVRLTAYAALHRHLLDKCCHDKQAYMAAAATLILNPGLENVKIM